MRTAPWRHGGLGLLVWSFCERVSFRIVLPLAESLLKGENCRSKSLRNQQFLVQIIVRLFSTSKKGTV